MNNATKISIAAKDDWRNYGILSLFIGKDRPTIVGKSLLDMTSSRGLHFKLTALIRSEFRSSLKELVALFRSLNDVKNHKHPLI